MYLSCNSKHSTLVAFKHLNLFLITIDQLLHHDETKEQKLSVKFPESFSLVELRDIAIKIKAFGKLSSKVFDKIFFWTAHSKIYKKLKKQISDLLVMIDGKGKDKKLDQDTQIKAYLAEIKVKVAANKDSPDFIHVSKFGLNLEDYSF